MEYNFESKDINTSIILPCPFCGSQNVNVYEKYIEQKNNLGMYKAYYTFCLNCSTSSGSFLNESDAIIAWNRRYIT